MIKDHDDKVFEWRLIFKVRRCHKWFRDDRTGRIAAADYSGDYPDDTDDGVLWLDTSRPVSISPDGHNVRIWMQNHTGMYTLLGGTNAIEARELIDRGFVKEGPWVPA